MKVWILLILVCLTAALWPEAERIVFYDSERVLNGNKELQEAQRTLDAEIAVWEQEIQEIEVRITQFRSEYELKKLTLLPSGQQEAEQRIAELENEKEDKIAEIYGEDGLIITRNQELLQPIMNKLNSVIEKLAVENNYSLVLDAASGAIGYAKGNLDITDDIIEEMESTLDVIEEQNK